MSLHGKHKYPDKPSTMLDDSRQSKGSHEHNWALTIKYLQGHQWSHNVDDRAALDIQLTRGAKARRVTANRMLPIYRTQMSRLEADFPGVVVMPASDSSEDAVKSQSAQLALRYQWHADDHLRKLHQAAGMLLTCGTAALHTFVRPSSAGPRVTTEVVGPLDLFFEKDCGDVRDSRWVAIRQFWTREELLENYEGDAKAIKAIKAVAPKRTDQDGEAAHGVLHLGGILTRRNPSDRLETYEIYWRDGRHAIVLEDAYLWQGEIDPEYFPIEVIQWTTIYTETWSPAPLGQLVNLQWAYNAVLTNMLRNIEHLCHPKLLVPRGAQIERSAWTDRAGGIITYNASGGEPREVRLNAITQGEMEYLALMRGEVDNTSSTSATSRGHREAAVKSGIHAQTLAGLDAASIAETQSSIEKALSRAWRCTLHLMQEYYTESTMMRMLDQFGRVVHRAIQSTDLSETPEVFIEAGTLFRDGATERRAAILELAQLGLVTPDEAREALSFNSSMPGISEKIQALAHASQLIMGVASGLPIEIYLSDDLQAVSRIFGEFMRTETFYALDDVPQDYLAAVLQRVDAVRAGAIQPMGGMVWPPPPGDPMMEMATPAGGSTASPAMPRAPSAPAAPENVYQDLGQKAAGGGLGATGLEQGLVKPDLRVVQ